MPLTIDLTGRVALVTGASGGIGLGIARQLHAAGATVVGLARGEPLPSEHPLRHLSCDVRDESQLRSAVDAIGAEFGRLDILVSNAGVNRFFGASACTDEQWRENMDLNLASHWRLARLARPLLERSGRGVIEIMTSNQGFAALPGCFPYNIAKTALTGLVRALAVEWGPSIRTIGLAPGFIDTEGNQKWFDAFPDPAAERARTVKLHPAGRLGTVEELGAWAAFLASDHAAFATGTTFVIDGGRLALLQDPA